ncbi:phosphoribosylglycinamide formyltransferase [Echinicola sp. 20G]|uniref:phosphoribosylglycinamide formyltransferase n=1 Tax=Echinicola sp. 20G TaxID=2781961 RepID=UPI00190FC5F6|nr:phosphoribosylglycinamide formyltransferase [Echinicola sp. 20G]
MKKIAIIASGNGSNAEEIINHFDGSSKAKVLTIASNKKDAYVLERAKNHEIPFFSFTRSEMEEGILEKSFLELGIDLIVLAGFLLKIPDGLIKKFPNRIINIHPALLPKFGGKGMYGMRVHEAVKEKGEKETGITIHYVNEKYDDGRVIFQESVTVLDTDTPEDIANKVHALEYKYFPKVIESLL